jgi:hypothetical protein
MNLNSGITLLLTAVLVLATIYYAKKTRDMVGEMRDSRRLSVLPKMVIDVEWLGPQHCVIVATNVGTGAALNADLRITFEPRDEQQPSVVRRWRDNVIAPGERLRFWPSAPDNDTPTAEELGKQYPRISLAGQVQDALGHIHRVDHSLDDLAELRAVAEASNYMPQDEPVQKIAKSLEKVEKHVAGIHQELKTTRLAGEVARRRPPTARIPGNGTS